MKISQILKAWFKGKKTKYKILKYYLQGGKAWSPGYVEARQEYLIQQLSRKKQSHGWDHPNYGLGFDERVIEIPWVIRKLADRPGNLWDVGSALNREELLEVKKIQKKRIFISNLNPECKNYNQRNISYLYEDAARTSLKNDLFEEIICVSTIEHVGFDNSRYDGKKTRQHDPARHLQLIKVFRAKLQKGGKLFLTFPFGARRSHGWFQVFDASMVKKVIRAFAPMSFEYEIFKYRENGWSESNENDSAKCSVYQIIDSRGTTLPIPGAEAVACLAMQR